MFIDLVERNADIRTHTSSFATDSKKPDCEDGPRYGVSSLEAFVILPWRGEKVNHLSLIV